MISASVERRCGIQFSLELFLINSFFFSQHSKRAILPLQYHKKNLFANRNNFYKSRNQFKFLKDLLKNSLEILLKINLIDLLNIDRNICLTLIERFS